MKIVFRKKDAFSVEAKNPERILRIWLDEKSGAKNISCGTTEIPSNSQIPWHSHEKEEEVMFIYKGKGIAEVEGQEDCFLEPETVVYIPPGLKHLFRNTGTEPLCFAFFYSPPGPEQVVRVMAKKEIKK